MVTTTKMQEHACDDMSCVCHALNFADGKLKDKMFDIRFGSIDSEQLEPYLTYLSLLASIHS